MSSRGPPLFPDTTAAGIAVNPRTLERVIPATKRADGSVRKEIKIRPGFTPAEDIAKFRTSRQEQRNALPKGAVVGYTPPPAAAPKPSPAPATNDAGEALTAAAKKNAKRAEKRKEKRKAEQADFIRAQFEGDGGDVAAKDTSPKADAAASNKPLDELADKLKDVQVS